MSVDVTDWLAPVLLYMQEMRFDWLTHALPLEKLNISQISAQATERNGTTIRQRMTSPH